MRKSVLRNFAKFTGKHLYQSLFFNKAVDFAKFLRTPFLQNNSGRLHLTSVLIIIWKRFFFVITFTIRIQNPNKLQVVHNLNQWQSLTWPLKLKETVKTYQTYIDHSFSMYAKFSEKLTLLTPWNLKSSFSLAI